MSTYVKIETITIGSGGAGSMVFSSIPQTYTDLSLSVSARTTSSGYTEGFWISVNGGSSYSDIELYNQNGTAAAYGVRTSSGEMFLGHLPASSSTANTFGNTSIYISDYTSTGIKTLLSDGTTENNGSQVYQTLIVGKITNSAAITTITLNPYGFNFPQYSTATLYGIKKN